MTQTYEIDGDTWKVYLGDDAPRPGVLPLIFHCTSNFSNGWRVLEVPEDEFGSGERIAALTDAELADLFERAQPFDHSKDPKAREFTVGDTPLR